MKKIYSPLLEAILALYLGYEWIQVRMLITFHTLCIQLQFIIQCVLNPKFTVCVCADEQHSSTDYNARDILFRGFGSRALENPRPSTETEAESSQA